MSGGGARVSIPADVRPTIEAIKAFADIKANHTDDEIYSMLKECAMDPNYAAQKLLTQDTFHEVKKKSKKKESAKELADPRWRTGVQGRGGRVGRGGYSSRFVNNDVAGERNVSSKENGVNQDPVSLPSKGSTPASPVMTGTGKKPTGSISSSVPAMVNGPSMKGKSISSQGYPSQIYSASGMALRVETSVSELSKTGTSKSMPNSVKGGSASGQSTSESEHFLSTKFPSSVSGVCASVSDPVLLPPLDARNPCEVSTIKRVVGSQWTTTETANNNSASQDVSGSELPSTGGKESTAVSSSYGHGKMHIKSQGSEENQCIVASQVASSSSFTGPAGSRPSSNYSNHSQQPNSSQKAVPSKEWKPKSTPANSGQASVVLSTSDVAVVLGTAARSSLASHSVALEEATLKIEENLDELQLSDRQHVIIPNHLQVPEAERHGLNFGSFDASFKLNFGFVNSPVSDKSATPPSELSQEIEENVQQPSSSIHTISTVQESENPDHPQLDTQMPENYSSHEAGTSDISGVQKYDKAKQEPALAPEGHQYSVIQAAPPYSAFGLVPQMFGSQLTPFETSESQACDSNRVPSFVVQQPFDLSTSYYNQLYRPTADADGRFSPFLAPGGSTKYNGNIAILPAQSCQASQESGNSIVLSTAGSTPLATQAAVQTSITVPQQQVPVFRQPAGVHISHYPTNYIPYNQYFSPFYVPPPALHPFLSNAAFPPQSPASSLYPPAGAAAAATPVKFSLSQYKPGTDTGNSTIVGMPTVYGTYNSNPAGYNPTPAVSSGNSNNNEDLNSSQRKENNAYIPGQQSEGLAVWIPASGRDISSLQASSFYSIPPQGQQMTFAPAQAGHGAFSGIYHPTPTVAAAAVHPLLQQSQTIAGAVEVVGPPSGVYQQPQHAQINWANSY